MTINAEVEIGVSSAPLNGDAFKICGGEKCASEDRVIEVPFDRMHIAR